MGLSFTLTRTYRSALAKYKGLFGTGWELSVHRWVKKPYGGQELLLSSGGGPVAEWVESSVDPGWYDREGSRSVFQHVDNGPSASDLLHHYLPSGVQETYTQLDLVQDEWFYLTSIRDLAGNELQFAYEDASTIPGFPTEWRLKQVTDTAGRLIDFGYTGQDSLCVTEVVVRDPQGSELGRVNYSYVDIDVNGETIRLLDAVEGLAVATEGQSGAHDFQRPVRRYEYNVAVQGGSGAALLEKVKSARAGNSIIREWSYGLLGQPDYWKVTQQRDWPASTRQGVHTYQYGTTQVLYTGPVGVQRKFILDGGGRITERHDLLDPGTSTWAITKWEYDSACSCSRVSKVTYPDGRERHFDYDSSGNVVAAWWKDTAGQSYRVRRTTWNVFDPKNGFLALRRLAVEPWRNAGSGELPGNDCSDGTCGGSGNPPGHLRYDFTWDSLGFLTNASYDIIASRPDVAADLARSQEFVYSTADPSPRLAYRLDKTNGVVLRRTEYYYDANGYPAAIVAVDPVTGATWTTSYERDAWGRLTGITHPDGRHDKVERDPGGRVYRKLFGWNQGSGTAEQEQKQYYNVAGDLVLETLTAGQMSSSRSYARDDRNAVSSITVTGSDGSARTWTYEYDSAGRRTRTTDWRGIAERVEYDDGALRVPIRRWVEHAGQNELVWEAGDGLNDPGYDSSGRPTSFRNASGWRHYFMYDSFGRPRAAWTQIGSDRFRGSRFLYNARGHIKEVETGVLQGTDPNNIIEQRWYVHTALTVNLAGHLLARATYESEQTETEPSRYSYRVIDGLGRSVAEHTLHGDRSVGLAGASETTVQTTYDGLDRPLSVSVLGDGGSTISTTTWEFREAEREIEFQVVEGGRTRRTILTHDVLWRTTQVEEWDESDTANRTTSHEYDGLGRRTAVVHADGKREEFDYNGVDLLTAHRVLPVGGGAPHTTMYTRRQSDGVLESVTDATGSITSYTYGSFLRPLRTTHPDGRWFEIEAYDALSRPIRTRDSRGITHDLTYEYQRLVEDAANPDSVPNVGGPDKLQWEFDSWTSALVETRTLDSGGGVLWRNQFVQNSLGEPIQETQGPNGQELMWTWEYGLAGELRKTTYPSGFGLESSIPQYDSAGRVTAWTYATATSSPLLSYSVQYDGIRLSSRHEAETGTRMEYAYDQWGRATSALFGPTSGGFTPVAGEYVARDLIGRIVARQRFGDSLGEVFEHDSFGRMSDWYQGVSNPLAHQPGTTPATWSDRESYTLNEVYARESVEAEQYGATPVTTTYSTNAAHFYDQIAGQVRGVDHGYLSDDGTFTYTYDSWGRLAEVRSKASGTLERAHTYDALGRLVRVFKATDPAIRLAYWGSRSACLEVEGTTEKRAYGYVGNASDEVFVYATGTSYGDGVYHFVRDRAGSLIGLTDLLGVIVEEYEYTVFGTPTILTPSGTPLAESAYGVHKLFLGSYYEGLTGQHFLGARWYESETGAFTSPDPSGPADSFNLYQYGFGTPATWSDPSGLRGQGGPGVVGIPEWPVERGGAFGDTDSVPAFRTPDGRWIVYTEDNRCDGTCTESQCPTKSLPGDEPGDEDEDADDDGSDQAGEDYWHLEDGDVLDDPTDPRYQALEKAYAEASFAQKLLNFATYLDYVSSAFAFVPGWGQVISIGAAGVATVLRVSTGAYDDQPGELAADTGFVIVGVFAATRALRTGNAARGGGKVGGKITGYTEHGLNQAIGRDGGRGVHPEAILDAVRNPTKVVEQAGGTTKYIGEQGTVILNSEGKVVTTWGRPRNPAPNQ